MSSTPPPPPPAPAASSPTGNFDIGAAFNWAWKKFQENAAVLIVSSLIAGAIPGVVIGIGWLIGTVLLAGGSQSCGMTGAADVYGYPSYECSGGNGFLALLGFLVLFAFYAVGFLIGLVLSVNFIRQLLKVADGQKPAIGDMLAIDNLKDRIVFALWSLLIALIPIAGGFVVVWSLYVFADGKAKGFDAIKEGFELVKANLVTLIIAYLLGALIATVGIVACFIGMIVTIPIGYLFQTYGYRFASKGHIAT